MSAIMWIQNRSLVLRRTLALAGVVVVAVVAWFGVLSPLMKLRSAHAEWVETTRTTVAEDRGLAAIEGTLKKQLAQVRDSPLWGKLYAVKSRHALTAALQADVGTLVRAAGGSAQTVAPLPESTDRYFERGGVRLTVSLTIDQLQNLLQKIESHARLLHIEQLTVVAPQFQTGGVQNPLLTVTIEIYGYARIESSNDTAVSGPSRVIAPGQRTGSSREQTQS